MKPKQVQELANTLCHMASGWRLYNDYDRLGRLGDGVIRIDALSGGCTMEGKPIPSLLIAGELQSWFQEHVERLGIPPGFIQSASVDFRWKASRTRRKEVFLSLIRCDSTVETPDKTFFGIYGEVMAGAGWGQRKPEPKTRHEPENFGD